MSRSECRISNRDTSLLADLLYLKKKKERELLCNRQYTFSIQFNLQNNVIGLL